MTNRYMKRCSTSAAIREMQIKITKSYHYTPIRSAKIKTVMLTNAGKNAGKLALSHPAVEKVKSYSHHGN